MFRIRFGKTLHNLTLFCYPVCNFYIFECVILFHVPQILFNFLLFLLLFWEYNTITSFPFLFSNTIFISLLALFQMHDFFAINCCYVIFSQALNECFLIHIFNINWTLFLPSLEATIKYTNLFHFYMILFKFPLDLLLLSPIIMSG